MDSHRTCPIALVLAPLSACSRGVESAAQCTTSLAWWKRPLLEMHLNPSDSFLRHSTDSLTALFYSHSVATTSKPIVELRRLRSLTPSCSTHPTWVRHRTQDWQTFAANEQRHPQSYNNPQTTSRNTRGANIDDSRGA